MNKKMTALVAGLAMCGAAFAQDEEEAPVLLEAEAGFFDGWDGSVSFGLFGTSGNTERYNMRADIDGGRKTDRHITSFLGTFTKAAASSEITEQKGRFFANNDFLIDDSEWAVFANANLEYDEFKEAWDTRLSLFGGAGRVLFDDDKTFLNARAGFGATREIGGVEEDWTFEGLLGADLTHKLTESQSLEAKVVVNPELEDVGEFRVFTRVAWTMMVAPSANMSLIVGAENTYDSSPGAGDKRNDIDYFAMLSWAY